MNHVHGVVKCSIDQGNPCVSFPKTFYFKYENIDLKKYIVGNSLNKMDNVVCYSIFCDICFDDTLVW